MKALTRFGGIAILLPMLLGSGCAPLVSTHKVKWVDNEPLRTPVTISSIQENRIGLADGREVQLNSGVDLPKFSETPTAVELETASGAEYEIYVKARSVVRCGNPYIGLIKIPLFSDRMPKYYRYHVGRGTVQPTER